MEDSNNSFKMKTAEWKGYVSGKLEHIADELVELKVDIKDTHKKMDGSNRDICKKIDGMKKDTKSCFDKINEKVNTLQMKVFSISAVLSLVVAIVFRLAFG